MLFKRWFGGWVEGEFNDDTLGCNLWKWRDENENT